MKKISQVEQAIKENFDWQNFDDTDLAGPVWSSKCEEFIQEFFKIYNDTAKRGGIVPTKEKNQALDALLELFSNAIEEAKK